MFSIFSEDILESPSCGKFACEDITFQGALGFAPERSALVSKLLSQVYGVKKLQIAEHEKLDPELFLAPTLTSASHLFILVRAHADLKIELSDLSVNHSNFLCLQSPMPIQFRLSRFEITGDAPIPPHLLTSLLTPAFSTLTTLALNLADHLPAFTALLTIFPSFAPTLTRLELSNLSSSLLPLLSRCTSLRSLRLQASIRASDLESILESLNIPLWTLELCVDIDEWDRGRAWKHLEARDVLASVASYLIKDTALSELRELVLAMEGEKETSIHELGEMREVRDRCEDRGVEIIIDEEAREHYSIR